MATRQTMTVSLPPAMMKEVDRIRRKEASLPAHRANSRKFLAEIRELLAKTFKVAESILVDDACETEEFEQRV